MLLPNAQEQTYTKAFRVLRDKVAETFAHEDEPLGHMSVAHWHFDFERAAYNALQLVFPYATIICCLFHFRQAVDRKLGSLGLKPQYEDVDDNRTYDWVRKLVSTA
ncbi:MAG: transposase, partial [Gammaproteobacteria bacterium]|nr:transposase [Gammaproteobacteria bacterium]